MHAVIKKWGNSPALRIGASAMRAAAFDVEQRVTIRATRGRIVIEAAEPAAPTLDALVAGITPENRYDETEFGAPVGREVW